MEDTFLLMGARCSTQVGTGLDRDDAKALHWYHKAAVEDDDPAAQFNYGVMLRREGKDAEALGWHEMAAEARLPDAIHALGQLWHVGFHHSSNGRFVRDMTKARTYYERAISLGFLPATRDLDQLLAQMTDLGSHE